MLRYILIISLLFTFHSASAQKDVTTFGIQVKPIIPSKFFDSGSETVTSDFVDFTFQPQLGINFGMVVRKGFTNMFSLEVGLNMVRRNYLLEYNENKYNSTKSIDFAFVGYELPIQGLVYVKLGDKLWMNAAGGFSIDTYPTSIFSTSPDEDIWADSLHFDFQQHTDRNGWVQVSLIANYGFEYRTKDNGYFYLGASYHRPFSPIATSEAKLEIGTRGVDETIKAYQELSGSYLTFDIRYFFHEDPERQKKKKKSSKR